MLQMNHLMSLDERSMHWDLNRQKTTGESFVNDSRKRKGTTLLPYL